MSSGGGAFRVVSALRSVLKQDLKKNFTEYKSAADRKELFREVYLDLMKDGKTMK